MPIDEDEYVDEGRYRLGKRFFIHAYPIKGRLNKDGELASKRHRRINVAFNGAKAWQNSVYYWWWEFLKRNNEYRRCCESGGRGALKGLYEDFGNVFTYETNDFWSWWSEKVSSAETRGEYLFAEPLARRLEVNDEGQFDETDDCLIVKVPLEVRTNYLTRNFRKLLSDYDERVQAARRKSRARYKVAAKVRNSSLYTTLKVYDYAIDNPNAKHVEIAEGCGLIINTEYYFILNGKGSTVDLLKDGVSDVKLQRRFRRVYAQRCSKAVRRHLDEASDYIRGTAEGMFPLRYK